MRLTFLVLAMVTCASELMGQTHFQVRPITIQHAAPVNPVTIPRSVTPVTPAVRQPELTIQPQRLTASANCTATARLLPWSSRRAIRFPYPGRLTGLSAQDQSACYWPFRPAVFESAGCGSEVAEFLFLWLHAKFAVRPAAWTGK